METIIRIAALQSIIEELQPLAEVSMAPVGYQIHIQQAIQHLEDAQTAARNQE